MLLGLSAEKAEEYAARMLEQERLVGTIDQIDGVLFFTKSNGKAVLDAAARPSFGGSQELQKWDENVRDLVEEVERVSTLLQTARQKA